MKYILAIEAITIATGISVAKRLPPAHPSHIHATAWALPPQVEWWLAFIQWIWFGLLYLALLGEIVLFVREVIRARRENRPIRPMKEWLD